ncbi:MAG: hypothetical protein NZ518_02595, partial [Dehalococcoidia bacterium]|nr:hypothetical protein [Dehalococcoidia bacterium]
LGLMALGASVVADRQIAATPGMRGAKEARLGRYAGIAAVVVCLLAHALLLALDGGLYGVRVFG